MKVYFYSVLFVLLCCVSGVQAQHEDAILKGKVTDESHEVIPGAIINIRNTNHQTVTDADGNYNISHVKPGVYVVVVFATERKTVEKNITLTSGTTKEDFVLTEFKGNLEEVVIQDKADDNFGHTHLQGVEQFGIYEGKKSEVIVLKDLTANTATNNARQLYARITGLNVWESDGAGLQLGIGGRGLTPNRTSSFNTRQNGYDISADALGYPESYYTPPAEALERIEIVRGAASLQYGTQFGGMLNFKFKEGPRNKKAEVTSRQTLGSWGFFGSFNSIGGTVAKGKLNYYAYYHYKRGDGWRDNSDFNYHNAYVSLKYQATEKMLVQVDYTHLNYLAHQPGGLTDAMFRADARQSIRDRNWFKVDWNLMSVMFSHNFSSKSKLNIRNFGLIADRQSLGNLERINSADLGGNRTLIDGDFKNIGSEIRYLKYYSLGSSLNTLLVGGRFYHGTTRADQGDGDDGKGPDFHFLHPDNLENSSYAFPNANYALFAENIFNITDKLSLTPGVRWEYINTQSQGFYKEYTYDFAGNIVVDSTIIDNRVRTRDFVLLGIGASYKANSMMEVYGNFSQNYRAINFSDLRIANPNLVVDPNIHDEKGFTTDLGIRGSNSDLFTYELTAFYISYNDRIGQVRRVDQPPLYREYRFRGNIADARNVGVEMFGKTNVVKWFTEARYRIDWFVNMSFINAKYIHTEDPLIKNKKVEMVPPVTFRSGTTYGIKSFKATLQFSYTGKHFSDASNASTPTATAVEGIIASYAIWDLSTSYTWKHFTIEASCNNLLDAKYFTRRADSYPGPGIIPSDGRGFYVTLQGKF